jgi:hypothetical protein
MQAHLDIAPRIFINRILCILLLCSSILSPLRILPGNNRIDILLMPITGFGVILLNFKYFYNRLAKNRQVLLMLSIFYGWIWICAGLTPYWKTAIKYNILYSIYILIFLSFLLITWESEKIYQIYHRVIFNFLSVLGGIGIIEFFFPDFWLFNYLGAHNYLNYYPRVSSLMQNPNQFGAVMTLGVIIGIILHKKKVLNSYEFYLGMLLIFAAGALAASRNGWVLFILFIILGVGYKVLTVKEAVIYSLVWLFSLLFFPIPTYRLGMTDSPIFPLMQFFTEIQLEIPDPTSTAVSRLFIWKMAIAQTIQHPLTGIGIGVYAEHIGVQAFGRVGTHAHNLFLSLSAETGIPGLLIFLGLLGSMIRQADMKNGFVAIFVILLLVSQLPDFFIADPTFMIVAVYFFAIACNSGPDPKPLELNHSSMVHGE